MKQSLFFLILLFCVFGCRESEPSPEPPEELIPPSEVGAGFVSCLVDGKVRNILDKTGQIGSSFTAGVFSLSSLKRTSELDQGLGFEIYRVRGAGTYILSNENIGGYSEQKIVNDNVILNLYLTNSNYSGELKITFLDTERNIISGTFFFDAQDLNTNQVVRIRDGRFDIVY